MNNQAPRALYIHIPFCSHICTYCDFYKMRAKESVKHEYISTLIQELHLKKSFYDAIETIYIGGGTPSSIPMEHLKRLFDAILKEIDPSKLIEWTIEANPQDITEEFARFIQDYGINRVSLGVQSFQEKRLKVLGRTHTRLDVLHAIKILHQVGIKNVNADLIYGLPGDTIKLIKQDLIQIINMGFTHVSPYTLIIEPKTMLYLAQEENTFLPLPDEEEATIYRFIQRFLNSYGLYQYEISNFCIKGYESLHNQVYWKNDHYIGLGASASYYIDQIRYTNIKNLRLYTEGVKIGKLKYEEKAELTQEEEMQNEMMLGLRTIRGISLQEFEAKYGKALLDVYPVVNRLIHDKQLILKRGYIAIPTNRLYVSNTIILNFM
ncbi:MAG: radical SAM family heme chaperone HemW [Bacilli bacterium]|nr:radical SAM family heme chaperone HemW [Bacilli bacterium]